MQHTVPEQLSCGEIRYPYIDRDGTLLYEVVRHWPKRFEVVDPGHRVLPDGVIPAYVLYRLPELLGADPGETVWYTEGEKDVESLRDAGLIATTNPGGCRHGWKAAYAGDLRGRHVVIVPDADGPGQRLAVAVEKGLRGVAASVVILRLPIRGRDDVSDWLAHRGNIPRMRELAAKARYDAAGIEIKKNKRVVILSTRLTTLAKLALLTVLEASTHDGAAQADKCRITAGELAAKCSCHRVTAQRTLTDLHRQGVLRRRGEDWVLVWDVLAMLTIDPLRDIRLGEIAN